MNKFLLPAIVAAAIYLFAKKKSTTSPGTSDTTGGSSDLGQNYFLQMSSILESDPVWTQKTFPANFYEYVTNDYTQQQAGKPRTPEYAYGLPGSFMSVLDAWASAMGISEETHTHLWNLYSAYRQQLAKQNL